MSKLVDNLLGKLDQLKRKVMTDTETNNDIPIESSGNAEEKEEIVDSKGNKPTVASRKNVRKQGRPRRKNTKTTTKATRASTQKDTAKNPQKQQKESMAAKSKKDTKKVEKEPVLKLLINAEEPEECRIALIEDGRVESFHVTTVVHEQTKGNIYKGRVTAIEPNLQVAFVDIGTGKNGFLPFSEIHPEYYTSDKAALKHWKDLNIQDVIKKGQEMLVQVVKEAFPAWTFSGSDARQRQSWHFQKIRGRGGKGQAAHYDELSQHPRWDWLHHQDCQQGYYQDLP
jgi:ribonuclease E